MHIGIIGAGAIGGTLARKLTASGHTIKLAGSKGPEAVAPTVRSGERAKNFASVHD